MNVPGAGDRPDSTPPCDAAARSVLAIPELRDYQKINAEVIQRLDEGQRHIRLGGAEGQRLLLAGLAGPWSAIIEIEGSAGPELAAALDAPALTVVLHGPAADGPARGMRSGRLIVLGPAGDVLATALEGGVVLAAAGAGHRAGLNQRGGLIVVLGPIGRLAGERQAGGTLFAADGLGPYAGHGQRGGALIRFAGAGPNFGIAPDDASVLRTVLEEASPWLARSRWSA
jgi:glutamate synthase domain-containing protein 3